MKALFNFTTDNVVFIFNIIAYDFRNVIRYPEENP